MENMTLDELSSEWKSLRERLEDKRIGFDKVYREKHKNHRCKTKVHAWNGNWFCKHLTEARNTEFKQIIDREQKIISSIIYSIEKRNI